METEELSVHLSSLVRTGVACVVRSVVSNKILRIPVRTTEFATRVTHDATHVANSVAGQRIINNNKRARDFQAPVFL
jgi:hypothetical protein